MDERTRIASQTAVMLAVLGYMGCAAMKDDKHPELGADKEVFDFDEDGGFIPKTYKPSSSLPERVMRALCANDYAVLRSAFKIQGIMEETAGMDAHETDTDSTGRDLESLIRSLGSDMPASKRDAALGMAEGFGGLMKNFGEIRELFEGSQDAQDLLSLMGMASRLATGSAPEASRDGSGVRRKKTPGALGALGASGMSNGETGSAFRIADMQGAGKDPGDVIGAGLAASVNGIVGDGIWDFEDEPAAAFTCDIAPEDFPPYPLNTSVDASIDKCDEDDIIGLFMLFEDDGIGGNDVDGSNTPG